MRPVGGVVAFEQAVPRHEVVCHGAGDHLSEIVSQYEFGAKLSVTPSLDALAERFCASRLGRVWQAAVSALYERKDRDAGGARQLVLQLGHRLAGLALGAGCGNLAVARAKDENEDVAAPNFGLEAVPRGLPRRQQCLGDHGLKTVLLKLSANKIPLVRQIRHRAAYKHPETLHREENRAVNVAGRLL